MKTHLFKDGDYYKFVNNSEEVLCEKRRGSKIVLTSKLKPFQFLPVLGKVNKVFGWMKLSKQQISDLTSFLGQCQPKPLPDSKESKNKARNERLKYFLFIKPQLEVNYSMSEFQGGYHIYTNEYGKLSFFPKGDRLQFCNTGKWLDESAIEWIEENLYY